MKVLFLTVGLCVLIASTTGLRCLPCIKTPDRCPDHAKAKECRYGVVTDICGCCNICGKGPGEKCGGPWNFDGKCGDNLKCISLSGFDEWGYEGTCKHIKDIPPRDNEDNEA